MPIAVANSAKSGLFRPATAAAGLMLLLFASAPTMSSLDIPVVMPKRIFYLFPLADGPVIKGNERYMTDQMVDKAMGPQDAKVVPKTFVDSKDCPPAYLCESVQLHVQQDGDFLIVTLTFSSVSKRTLHPKMHKEARCGLRDDSLNGCLETDFNMLADDLLTHQKSDLDRLAGHGYGQ